MRYNALATALTVLIVLCATACSTSRKAIAEHSSQLRVEGLELRDSSAVERVEVLDTLKEVTTITIDRNDKGDTLKVVQITDLTRARSRDNVVAQKVKTEVRVDTVYVEKRDSVYIQNTNLTNPTNKKNTFVSSLKWICWIIIGLIGLIVTVKVCLLRR